MADPEPTPTQSKDTKQSSVKDELERMTPTQRIQYFRTYMPKVQALRDFSPPRILCNRYPHFTDEILKAYRKYTIFTVEVWTNYDSACKQFFLDKRLDDCGKLMMTPAALRRLERAIKDEQVQRIRYAVGTAFQTLCYLSIRLESPDPVLGIALKTTYQPQTGEHRALVDWVDTVCTELDGRTLQEGRTGFTLDNIKGIAAFVRRMPTDAEIDHKRRWLSYGTPSEWMDLSQDRENRGYVDMDELERQRLLGSGGG